ncbi:hypothetical protein BDN72DRAFT_862916 [Pluteus cervinus]|uniref:Uncharacterized protein n=1 Tax=Pluteus cervinus TaxID=181527 RepID=A0ACD3A9Y2_9AGAR|nr:hypothetical protein BDN72DRAFT_862916 [Pluteus cervinus]
MYQLIFAAIGYAIYSCFYAMLVHVLLNTFLMISWAVNALIVPNFLARTCIVNIPDVGFEALRFFLMVSTLSWISQENDGSVPGLDYSVVVVIPDYPHQILGRVLLCPGLCANPDILSQHLKTQTSGCEIFSLDESEIGQNAFIQLFSPDDYMSLSNAFSSPLSKIPLEVLFPSFTIDFTSPKSLSIVSPSVELNGIRSDEFTECHIRFASISDSQTRRANRERGRHQPSNESPYAQEIGWERAEDKKRIRMLERRFGSSTAIIVTITSTMASCNSSNILCFFDNAKRVPICSWEDVSEASREAPTRFQMGFVVFFTGFRLSDSYVSRAQDNDNSLE